VPKRNMIESSPIKHATFAGGSLAPNMRPTVSQGEPKHGGFLPS
jgi:hypothetical protein